MSFKEVKRQIFPGTFAHENNPKRDGAFNEFKHTSYRKDSTVFSEKKKVYCIWKSIDIFYKKGQNKRSHICKGTYETFDSNDKGSENINNTQLGPVSKDFIKTDRQETVQKYCQKSVSYTS